MSDFSIWIILAMFGLALLWGWDQHMELKDIEKELKEYLGDLEVARDISEPHLRVHFAATISQVKSLIKRHFKL
jgi:hypothetical protein